MTSENLFAIFRLVYRRLRRIAIAGLLIVIIAYVWDSTTSQSRQDLAKHTQQLARMSLQHSLHEARYWLAAEDTSGLQSMVDHLRSQPTILAATVQNEFGQQVASSGPVNSIIDWQEYDADKQPVAMVGEIRTNQGTLGYLQITFDYEVLLSNPEQVHQFLTQRGQVLMALAVLAGVLLMAGFNRIRGLRRTKQVEAVAP